MSCAPNSDRCSDERKKVSPGAPLRFLDVMNERAALLATHNRLKRPRLIVVKDHNGQVVILAERKRGAVHHFQAHRECAHIAYLIEFTGMYITHGIIVIDA